MALDIAGFETNMTTYGTQHGTYFQGASFGDPALAAYYYDSAKVFYNIGDYLNNASSATYYAYAAAAIPFYRDYYVIPNNGLVPAYWNFTDGLLEHWKRTGAVASKNAVVMLSKYGAYAADTVPDSYGADANGAATIGGTPTDVGAGAREIAYVFRAYLDAEQCGESRRPRTQHLVDLMLGHLDQWGTGAAYTYVRPFMVAITCDSLIRAVGAGLTTEAVVKAKMATVWTYLNSVAWDNPNNTYKYTDKVVDSAADVNPAYDLGLLIAPVLQWLGGAYKVYAEEQFNSSVTEAYLAGSKQFNQNYVNIFNLFAWKAQQDAGDPTSPPEGNTEVTVAESCMPPWWVRGYPIPAVEVITDNSGDPIVPEDDPDPEPEPSDFDANNYGTLLYWADFTNAAKCLNTSGVACSDGEGIKTIVDSSAAAYQWTQSTGTAQPTFKTNIIAGNSVARFDGADYWPITLADGGTISKARDGLTIAFTTISAVTTGNDAVISFSEGGGGSDYRVYVGTIGGASARNSHIWTCPQDGGTPEQDYDDASAAQNGSIWHVILITFNFLTGHAIFYVNQTTLEDDTFTSTGATSNTNCSSQGNTAFGWCKADMTDLVIYNGVIASDARAALITALGARAGLSI